MSYDGLPPSEAAVLPQGVAVSFADCIQWLAFGLGSVGSVLWAHNGAGARYAAAFWLAASLLWLCFAKLSGLPGLAARDAISLATGLWGVWRWLGSGRSRP